MKELVNMKKQIEDIQNKRTDLASKRDEKINEANEIKDINSSFYRLPMKEANDIQKRIDELGENAQKIRKEFDGKLTIKKEEEIKRLEYAKKILDQLATAKKEDKDRHAIALNKKKETLQKNIESDEKYIEELENKINKYNIKSEYDVWNQSLKHYKESLRTKKENLNKYEIELNCLSAENLREEFKKIESRIDIIKKLNYNNIDEEFEIEESEPVIQENNEQSTEITENVKNNSIETSESKKSVENETNKTTEQKKKYIEKIHNSINQSEDKAKNVKETIIQNDENVKIENEIESKNETVTKNIENVSDVNKNMKEPNSILNSSLTDLQIKNQKTYNEAHKDMEKAVDKFYQTKKDSIDLNMDVDELQDKYNLSFDAALLLKSRMQIENPKKEEISDTHISLWNKVKNKFGRHKKEDNKMLIERKNGIFSRIRKALIDKIKKSEIKEDYSYDESKENLEDVSKDRLGNRIIKTEQEIKQDKKMEEARKSINIDIAIEEEKDEID